MPNVHAAATAVGAGVAGRLRVALAHGAGGTADVYADGGQVLSWRPSNAADVLFLSTNHGDRQIAHGGVPIVFPQFGAGALPQHGFARSSEWAIGERTTGADGSSGVTLTLTASPETRALWPHDFRTDLIVTLGPALTMTLRVTNRGPAPFTFTGGFHTYFRVRDVRRTSIDGLSGLRYRDKTQNFAEFTDHAPALVPSGETDRVYLGAPALVRIDDGERVIRVEATGFANVVVWNPGSAGDAHFGFANGEWTQFVCVEPATVSTPVVLGAGATWEATQTLSVESPKPRPTKR
jgi:glucose-6-phosphate 1-epimerase